MAVTFRPPNPRYVNVTVYATLSGPFFTRDPGKTLRGNVRDMLDKLAAEMERGVKEDIAGHASQMPRYTGWSTRAVRGYTTSVRTGKRWGTWAAVGSVTQGMSKRDAIRTKAAVAGRQKAIGSDSRNRGTDKGIEGRWHPYRKVKSAVYRSRALLTADLTKGFD